MSGVTLNPCQEGFRIQTMPGKKASENSLWLQLSNFKQFVWLGIFNRICIVPFRIYELHSGVNLSVMKTWIGSYGD